MPMDIKILAVGDVCGKPGLEMLSRRLRREIKDRHIDFTIVNGENANVVGITPAQAEDIFDAGADVITLGNHTWVRTELQEYLDSNTHILRPHNFAPQCPGSGVGIYETAFGKLCVINLMGRFSLDGNTDNPFIVAGNIVDDISGETGLIFVDFHAEATSEKLAMGYFLEGKVSAVWGTHTHVQTSDCCVLPGGTGYITDLGMTGPARSVLGIDPQQSIGKFLGDVPRRYSSAQGKSKLEGAVFTIDSDTGRCTGAEALRLE